jgi:uncharacterized protein
MNTGAIKIVLDTNVVVSMIGTNSPNRWIFDGILTGRFILCVSTEILLEYEEVLSQRTRPEVAKNFADFLVSFPFVAKTEVFFRWNFISNDPDDNKFVDCAVASNAFCIVSEDRHFKVVKKVNYPQIQVFTIAEFARLFQ